MIDEKDLQPFKASELVIGGAFYLKNDDGSYSLCRISEAEIKSNRVFGLRAATLKYAREGRLFVRINRPWTPFEP